ncbi:MAG: hypothetical protein ABI360_07550 [Allobranchiibius sp.]
MQATVHSFDFETAHGSVITDNGRVLPFGEQVFAASRLRQLRVGQRVSIEVGPGEITRLWIVGIGPNQRIA